MELTRVHLSSACKRKSKVQGNEGAFLMNAASFLDSCLVEWNILFFFSRAFLRISLLIIMTISSVRTLNETFLSLSNKAI